MTEFERLQLEDDRVRYNLETLFDADPPDRPLVYARDRWPAALEAGLRASGVLVDGPAAMRPVCDRCWRLCHVEAEDRTREDGGTYVVAYCEEGDVPRLMAIRPDQFATLRVDGRALARRVAAELGLAGDVEEPERGRVWRLGHRSFGGARRVVFLARGEVALNAVDENGAVVLATRPQRWAASDALVLPLRRVVGIHGEVTVDVEALEAAFGRKRRKAVEPIRVPAGLTWPRVIVRVLDDATIEVVAGGARERRTYAECGMGDARKLDREPVQAWGFLLLLARNGGSLEQGDPGSGEDERKAAQALREAMRRLFTPEPVGNPVLPWTTAEGWKAGFQLTDARSRR